MKKAVNLILGNSLEKLKGLEDNSIDSIVTDPPYHLVSIVKRFGKEGSAPAQYGKDGSFGRLSKGFMGKEWDGVDENGIGIAYNVDLWAECLRVLKPGGHLLAFSGTRTYHRMAVAIEDAGFEVRDMIEWVYGSGFPKSLNIGKAVDKLQGNEREDLGEKTSSSYPDSDGVAHYKNRSKSEGTQVATGGMPRITKGTSPYEGWGTALKPSHETIAVAQKPLTAVPFYGNIEEEIKSILCQLLLSVKTANKNLVLNHHGLSEELDIAQWIVKDSTNTQVALSVVMDMLQLELKTNTNWSIELLCLSFLKEIWKHTNIFTTEMKTSLIIELRTLNLLVSESILANITQSKKIKQDGENANVYFVENYLNAVLLKWNATLTHFAQENVMSKENKLTFAPNHEPICMARKPLAEKTVAENVLKYGTGGINIDASRIGLNEELDKSQLRTINRSQKTEKDGWGMNSNCSDVAQVVRPEGRFPANIIFDEEAGKILDEQSGHLKSGFMKAGTNRKMSLNPNVNTYGYFDSDTTYNDTYGDSGGASRFFKSIIYQAKASKAERNKGCEELDIKQNLQGLDNRGRTLEREDGSKTLVDRFSKTPAKNNHPTVKPIALMEYLIKMITPKGGTVLDPFMGSGSTGVAAKKNGYDFIGIDMTPEYIEIAKARIEATEIENKLL